MPGWSSLQDMRLRWSKKSLFFCWCSRFWLFFFFPSAPWVLLFLEMMQSLSFVFNTVWITHFPAREGQVFHFPVLLTESLALFFCSIVGLWLPCSTFVRIWLLKGVFFFCCTETWVTVACYKPLKHLLCYCQRQDKLA